MKFQRLDGTYIDIEPSIFTYEDFYGEKITWDEFGEKLVELLDDVEFMNFFIEYTKEEIQKGMYE